MKQSHIVPRFVDFIPTHLEDGVLYISQEYKTAIHKCCCGCGQEVVTPLSAAQWQVTVTRDKVSLNPSIGNWNFECKSHYWIKQNRVSWSYAFTEREIQHVQARDRRDLQEMTRNANLYKNNNQQQLNKTTTSLTEKTLLAIRKFWAWIRS